MTQSLPLPVKYQWRDIRKEYFLEPGKEEWIAECRKRVKGIIGTVEFYTSLVSFVCSNLSFSKLSESDDAVDILNNGYGLCCQFCKVFLWLLKQYGIEGLRAELKHKNRVDGHVVVFVGSERWVIDVVYKVVFVDENGGMCSLKKLVDNPILVKKFYSGARWGSEVDGGTIDGFFHPDCLIFIDEAMALEFAREVPVN